MQRDSNGILHPEALSAWTPDAVCPGPEPQPVCTGSRPDT